MVGNDVRDQRGAGGWWTDTCRQVEIICKWTARLPRAGEWIEASMHWNWRRRRSDRARRRLSAHINGLIGIGARPKPMRGAGGLHSRSIKDECQKGCSNEPTMCVGGSWQVRKNRKQCCQVFGSLKNRAERFSLRTQSAASTAGPRRQSASQTDRATVTTQSSRPVTERKCKLLYCTVSSDREATPCSSFVHSSRKFRPTHVVT